MREQQWKGRCLRGADTKLLTAPARLFGRKKMRRTAVLFHRLMSNIQRARL